MENEILKCIHSRRSTRSFTEEQITEEQLKVLLDAAVWAPSGGNHQSWLFTAIQNEDIINHINGLIKEAFKTWVPNPAFPGTVPSQKASQNENYHFCFHAPTLIIATNPADYDNAMADCSVALQNIFLAAESIGLGTCYINQLHRLEHNEKLKEYLFTLGIPKEHTICSSVAVGYIKNSSQPLPRKEGTTRIIR